MEILKKSARIRCMIEKDFHTVQYEDEKELYNWTCPVGHNYQKYRIIYLMVERIEAKSKSELNRLVNQTRDE